MTVPTANGFYVNLQGEKIPPQHIFIIAAQGNEIPLCRTALTPIAPRAELRSQKLHLISANAVAIN